jgi:hypothetical protein
MSKTMIGLTAILGLVVSTSLAMSAERPKKKTFKDDRATERIYSQPDANGWYPRDARLLKFGSQLWWEQMEREGRTGRRDW